jgi:hypothetical protein
VQDDAGGRRALDALAHRLERTGQIEMHENDRMKRACWDAQPDGGGAKRGSPVPVAAVRALNVSARPLRALPSARAARAPVRALRGEHSCRLLRPLPSAPSGATTPVGLSAARGARVR